MNKQASIANAMGAFFCDFASWKLAPFVLRVIRAEADISVAGA